MTASQVFEIAALLVTALLGVWLGLVVATRSPSPAGRRFAAVAIALAAWGAALLVERLSGSPEAIGVAHVVSELTSAFAIAATLDFSLLVATEGHPSPRQQRLVVLAYVANLVLALPSSIDHTISPTLVATGPLPAALFGWAWLLVRILTLGTSIAWLVSAARRAEHGTFRRRQVEAALLMVVVGTLGALLRFLPVIGQLDPWIGVSMVALSLFIATYAVLPVGIFSTSSVTGRAFATSVIGGATVTVIVGALIAIDTVSNVLLGLGLPLFTGLFVITAMALYEPAMQWVMEFGASPRTVARERLLRAMGRPLITVQPASAGVGPALERVATVLDVVGIAAIATNGEVIAAYGSPGPGARAVPLQVDDEVVGELRVGATRSGAELSDQDQAVLRLSAAYVANALRTGGREEAQVDSLVGLAAERELVEVQASELHEALVRGGAGTALRVHALGPLRVERDGAPIERWGGDKAGTRQAEALFAFLFDRGERGVTKDEVLQIIWPDTDLSKADLAFHRTMVGLRGTLDPGRGRKSVIRFHNDRYRLDPAVIAWSDASEFLARLASAREAPAADRIRLLEEARTLYRGEYLDDCPFYGDSSTVEERRTSLRERYRDLLLALGEAYEARDDRLSAAAAFREAASAGGGSHGGAGLARP